MYAVCLVINMFSLYYNYILQITTVYLLQPKSFRARQDFRGLDIKLNFCI